MGLVFLLLVGTSSINIDFNALAVHIKEVHLFKDKDLVYYKILGEDVMALFRDHTKFPKGILGSKCPKDIQRN